MNEEIYNEDPLIEEDEELSSKEKTIFWIILIGIVLVVAYFLNPSVEAHQQKIDDIIEYYEKAYSHKGSNYEFWVEAPKELRQVKYANLGVLSFTYVKNPTGYKLLTIGAFNYVHPVMRIEGPVIINR